MSFDVVVENSTDAELVDAIDQLHGVMACTQRQLLRFIFAYECRRGYVDDGARNMAEWLSARLGISYPTAKRWVRVASKLETLPTIAGTPLSRGIARLRQTGRSKA